MPSGTYLDYLDSGVVRVHLRVTEEEYQYLGGIDTVEICATHFASELQYLMVDKYNYR